MSRESGEIPGPVDCHNCVAACCRRGVLMPLDDGEVFIHQRKMPLRLLETMRPYRREVVVAMRDLPQIPAIALNVPAYRGLHILTQDCSYLNPDNQCTIYEDPTRPKACAVVEVGSEECVTARTAYAPEIIARQAEHPEMLTEI